MDLQLTGARVIVTGGSRGIGRAVTTFLAREGCGVEFCGRNPNAIERTVEDLAGQGLHANGDVADLSKSCSVIRWVKEAVARLGGLDIVVACASAMTSGPEAEAWNKNYAVEIESLRVLLNTVRSALKSAAKERGDASVVVVGSTSALKASRHDAYGAVKAALVHVAKGLSHEMIAEGVRVNMVSPGPTYAKDGFWGKVRRENPIKFAQKVGEIPVGQMADPDDIASAIVFLCSPRARHVVGSNLIIDGGRSVRPQW